MKKLKNILIFAMVLTMIFSFAGCKKKQKGEDLDENETNVPDPVVTEPLKPMDPSILMPEVNVI